VETRTASQFIRGAVPAVATPLLLLLIGILAASATAQTPPPVSFVARRDFAVGRSPSNVAAADINSDGKLDIVTA